MAARLAVRTQHSCRDVCRDWEVEVSQHGAAFRPHPPLPRPARGQGEDLSTPRHAAAHSQTRVLQGDWEQGSLGLCDLGRPPL